MREEVKYGAGCMTGVLGVGLGGITTVVGLIIAVVGASAGWIVAGVGVLVLAISAVFTAVSGERAKEAATKSWAIREYRNRLTEIDKLIGQLAAMATPERLSQRGADDLKARLTELRAKKAQILKSLVELDKFLKAKENRPMTLDRDKRNIQRRIKDSDDPATTATLEQNFEAIEKTEAFLDRVRGQRPSLIAQLDKILFGLRSTKAQLLAEVSRETATDVEAAGELAATIEGDIKEMTRSIQAVDGMRAEIDDLVKDRAKKAASRQTQ